MSNSRFTPLRQWLPAISLLVLALAAMGLGFRNRFAQDDLPIILQNPAAQHPGLQVFSQPYWPPGWAPDLYRPFATLTLALEWHLGGKAEWPIHAWSLGLYLLLTLAFLTFARRLMPLPAAWLAAAIFAVHPVHVEAVAVGVNQGELMVALIALLMASSYLDGRQLPAFGTRRAVALVAALAVACFYKENAVVIPGLLLAAELTVLRAKAAPAEWRLLRPLYLGFALVIVAFLTLRSSVLGGFAGSFTAEGLMGLGVWGRIVTMLGVIPIWLRLLVWPEHLQADYSPQEIVGGTQFHADQWLGLGILTATIALAVACRKRAPEITYGVLWFAIAIFPVSNIAVATGIVLAERTLLLPSAGFLLVVGGAVAAILRRWHTIGAGYRRLALAGVAALLALGIWRSAARTTVWHDNDHLWARTVEDAPLSYRAHHARAQYYFNTGNYTLGERHAFRAIELYPNTFQVRAELGDRYRQLGMCEPAVEAYKAAMRLAPGRSDARASLLACLFWLGRYATARGQARIGRAWGADMDVFEQMMALADSAERAGAPPKSVRITLPARFGSGSGVKIGSPPTASSASVSTAR